ncbi:hypothetical protein DYB25_010356 [Aphanomyces astaci]|uniref:TM7S3/TM198-like domain-containing protein n=1 Tax=Aphanomyces astaci TaxID=112090 RepID=A0A397AZM6_APHAT|nr:hypothetical protein DYB25_010356 [Aphanomyces astaci]
MLLLSYGAHTMAQPPAHVVGITIAPNAEPLAVPASELNNSVVLLLSAGIRDVMTMKSLAVPPAIRTNEIVVDDTDLDLLRPPQSKVHAISGITAALSIVSGAFVAILGFKMRRLAALLCGFAVGGLSCYALATTVLFSDPSSIVLGAWLSFLVGGLLVGVICMLVEQVGNFVVGASGGASMTILIHISFNYLGSPSNPNAALYIFGAILSLTLGLVAVLMGKPLLIVATGLTGALEFVWGIGYFVGQYPCVIALPRTQYLTGGAWHYDNPSAWWVYLSASLAVAIVGIGLQFAVTAVDAPPKKPQDLHHATRKSGHRDLPFKFAVSHVTPRKDQSMRGTCWDFATIGVLEQSYRAEAIRKGYLTVNQYVSFSEQMWKNSTEGGEVAVLYYLQYGLKESVFPDAICPYLNDNNGSDSICPGLSDTRHADNPISFTIRSMETWYEDLTIKQQLFAQNKAMALSTPVTYVTHYYPCLSRFSHDSDPHCSVDQCTLCPPEMAATTCCIPLKGGRNRNMEGEFFHHRGMTIEGGHAMLLVGYNDAFLTRDGYTGGLIVKNSWLDGPTQGSHSLAYWMQEVSDWEERVVCPNSYNPFNWYQCGNNAASPVVTPHNDTTSSSSLFNRTKAFDEGVGACLSEESRIYAHVNMQPLRLECVDRTACSLEPNTTYFVRNTTDWGDRMTVMCVWEHNLHMPSREFCLKPMLEVDIARTLRPVAHEVRANDPDRCGFYFMPYASIRQYIAQFQGFYVNSFDIEWAPQSFAANRHKFPHLNYTLLKRSTRHQNRSSFDGPFPHARVVAPEEFHPHAHYHP